MDQALGFDGEDPGTGILDLQWDDPNDPNGATIDPTPKVHVDGEITAAAPVASIPYELPGRDVDRSLLTGVLRNRVGFGWTPVDGFGYINAQARSAGADLFRGRGCGLPHPRLAGCLGRAGGARPGRFCARCAVAFPPPPS